MTNDTPGSYRMGQIVRYKKWQAHGEQDTGVGGDGLAASSGEASDAEQPHAGPIVGYIFRDNTFYYLVEYESRLEAVLPEDILDE